MLTGRKSKSTSTSTSTDTSTGTSTGTKDGPGRAARVHGNLAQARYPFTWPEKQNRRNTGTSSACSRRPGPKARHPLHKTKHYQHQHKRRPWTCSTCSRDSRTKARIPLHGAEVDPEKNTATTGAGLREPCPKARYPTPGAILQLQ